MINECKKKTVTVAFAQGCHLLLQLVIDHCNRRIQENNGCVTAPARVVIVTSSNVSAASDKLMRLICTYVCMRL